MFDNRVSINPDMPKKGRDVEIKYDGLLSKCGADSVYLHYGFDGFNNPKTVYMERRH
ncbi:MAG: carbohydrate-binding protein, partial [Firmicutes bacterium HGW-Firmicutes-13]